MYAYASGDPVTNVDPSGLADFSAWGVGTSTTVRPRDALLPPSVGLGTVDSPFWPAGATLTSVRPRDALLGKPTTGGVWLTTGNVPRSAFLNGPTYSRTTLVSPRIADLGIYSLETMAVGPTSSQYSTTGSVPLQASPPRTATSSAPPVPRTAYPPGASYSWRGGIGNIIYNPAAITVVNVLLFAVFEAPMYVTAGAMISQEMVVAGDYLYGNDDRARSLPAAV